MSSISRLAMLQPITNPGSTAFGVSAAAEYRLPTGKKNGLCAVLNGHNTRPFICDQSHRALAPTLQLIIFPIDLPLKVRTQILQRPDGALRSALTRTAQKSTVSHRCTDSGSQPYSRRLEA